MYEKSGWVQNRIAYSSAKLSDWQKCRYEIKCTKISALFSADVQLLEQGVARAVRKSPVAGYEGNKKRPSNFDGLFFVENTRVELVTSCMPCKRSSQLS